MSDFYFTKPQKVEAVLITPELAEKCRQSNEGPLGLRYLGCSRIGAEIRNITLRSTAASTFSVTIEVGRWLVREEDGRLRAVCQSDFKILYDPAP